MDIYRHSPAGVAAVLACASTGLLAWTRADEERVFSLVACLRNFRALVVFGLSWVLLLIFLLLAVTLLASAIDLGDSLGALMFPLMLLVAAMFFARCFSLTAIPSKPLRCCWPELAAACSAAQPSTVNFATLKASHFTPWRGKLICARASSPTPSRACTVPSPNLLWKTFMPVLRPWPWSALRLGRDGLAKRE